MRSASEGYNQRYAGDLPPRHGSTGGAPQIRPLPTPRPSPSASHYPESTSRDAYPDYVSSSYYGGGYQSPHRPQHLPLDEQYRGGASGVRQDPRRGVPSDSYRPNDGLTYSPATRGSLSPVSSRETPRIGSATDTPPLPQRPSPRFDDTPHSDLYQSYGSPPARSHPSLAPLPPRSPLPPSAIVTATADLESLIVVPLNNLSTIEAIKEVIMTRLHIADDDQPRHTFYLTRIGAGEGRPVSDEELWAAVKSSTRGDGPQITVYVKETGSPRAGQWEGRSAAEFASAAGSYHDRTRNMHARDRETSRSSGSGGGGRPPSPISAASYHRQKSPSVSSSRNSDPAALMAQEMSRNRTFDELEAARRAQGGGGASLSGRQASNSSYVHQRMTTSPQSAGTILSPSYDSRFNLSGSAPRSSSNTTPKTSPEEYFHYASAQHQTVASPAGSSSLSPPPSASQSHAQSSQTFGGPTRRLPSAPAATMPEARTQTVPLLSVTCGDWSRPVQAAVPQHSPSLPTSHAFTPHPPRALPPVDARSTMRQYASDPYRNLPLPSNQSPYHNLSLQGRSNVVHLPQPPRNGFAQNALPPRAATLAAPQQAGLAMSRSADNLRSTYDQSAIEAVGLSRSPATRVTPHPTGRAPNETSPPSNGMNLASAFYSAPVQAQQQASSYAPRGVPSPFSPPSAANSRSEWSTGIDRPSTATGFMHDADHGRAREGSSSSSLGVRRQSGTVEDLDDRFAAQLSLRNDSNRSARIEFAAPQFAEDDGAYDGISERSRAPSHPSIETLAQASVSPPSSTRSSLTGPITPASDLSHNRFSITPATVDKPRLVDEFGDPLDEETGTWFPVNQPAAAPTPTPSSDRQLADTETSLLPQATTAVPAAKSYGVTSPTRAQVTLPQQALKPTDRRTSVPDAQDWTQTILSRFGASSATDSGTLLPTGAAGTLRPAPSNTSAPASAAQTPTLVDEFGDDLEDSSTFFPGHGPAAKEPSLSQDDGAKERSLANRPSLKLKIGANATPTSAPPTSQSGRDSDRSTGRGPSSNELESARSDRRTDGPPSSRNRRYFPSRQERPGAESPFARRNSLAARASDDNDWAFRPPVETVLEHLDVFFPQHDLDKPVFDLAGSPASGATPNNASPAKDLSSTSNNRKLGYHKSIRVVAQDRKRMLQKAGRNVATAASGLASNLLRRRSTKLFGAKIEEVTSAQMNEISSLHQVDNDDPENCKTPIAKWLSDHALTSSHLQSRTNGSRVTLLDAAHMATSTSL